MTRAQERLATLVEWVKASSTSENAPLGKDTVVRGPWAVFVPQALELPPGPTFAPGHLPLWIPAQQAIPTLPPWNVECPPNQQPASERLLHLVWAFAERFEGALLGLPSPDETLRSALDRQAPGLDLEQHPAVLLPLWGLTDERSALAAGQMPVLRL